MYLSKSIHRLKSRNTIFLVPSKVKEVSFVLFLELLINSTKNSLGWTNLVYMGLLQRKLNEVLLAKQYFYCVHFREKGIVQCVGSSL